MEAGMFYHCYRPHSSLGCALGQCWHLCGLGRPLQGKLQNDLPCDLVSDVFTSFPALPGSPDC